MIKFFKRRVAEERDIQKVVAQFTQELKAQRTFISRELASRDTEIKSLRHRIISLETTQGAHSATHGKFSDAMKSAIQHILLHLPVKQSRDWREFHNKKLSTDPATKKRLLRRQKPM